MAVAIYLAGALLVCCVIWLILASIGRDRGDLSVSWHRVWLPVLASTVSAATLLMIRFVAIEAPVSAQVVMRGWLGFFFVFAAVFSATAALMMAVMGRVRLSRSHGDTSRRQGRHA